MKALVLYSLVAGVLVHPWMEKLVYFPVLIACFATAIQWLEANAQPEAASVSAVVVSAPERLLRSFCIYLSTAVCVAGAAGLIARAFTGLMLR